MRILIAEDEKKIAGFIRKALKEASYAVDKVHDGNLALECAITTAYNAIILDVMMPGKDGLGVLKLLREQRIETPVLLLTARGQVSERIGGLERLHGQALCDARTAGPRRFHYAQGGWSQATRELPRRWPGLVQPAVSFQASPERNFRGRPY